MVHVRGRLLFLLVAVNGLLLFSVGSAMGSGVAIIEQSASMAGYAYAGAAAAAQDASTLFFNPAGMAKFDRNEVQAGAHYLLVTSDFTNQGSTNFWGDPLTGPDDDGGENALVPNLYYIHSISEQWKAGIAVTAPYGLATEYEEGWVGRYHALRSELTTYNINPSVAYRFNEQWAVGVGVSIEYAEAELSSAVDFGAAADIPSLSQTLDGKATVTGDNWNFGGNIGLLYEPLVGTRLGMHYRSQIKHKLEGDADFIIPDAIAAQAQEAGYYDTGGTAEITLPDTVSLSAYHDINERWAILADVTWTHWSHWNEIRIKFDSGAGDSVTTLDWDDTFRYALGAIYKATDSLVLRAGAAFDESPIPSAKNRTPRLPGADRIWVTLGGGYQFSNGFRVDAAYAHLFVDDPKVDKDLSDPENKTRGALVGEYDCRCGYF